VSLFDIALLLTNAVFRLGYSERNSTEKCVMKNSSVKHTAVKQSLDGLKKLITPHEDKRHLYVHRGKIQNPKELDWLKLVHLLQETHPDGTPDVTFDLAYGEHAQKLCETIQEESDTLHDRLSHFFDTLSPIYDEKFKVICEEWLDALKQEVECRGLTRPL